MPMFQAAHVTVACIVHAEDKFLVGGKRPSTVNRYGINLRTLEADEKRAGAGRRA